MENDNDKNTYSDALNTLSKCLNNRINKTSVTEFKATMVFIKNVFNKDLSTKFLKNLINNNIAKDKKSHIVGRFIKRAEIKTEPSNRYFKTFSSNGMTKSKECLNFLIV